MDPAGGSLRIPPLRGDGSRQGAGPGDGYIEKRVTQAPPTCCATHSGTGTCGAAAAAAAAEPSSDSSSSDAFLASFPSPAGC